MTKQKVAKFSPIAVVGASGLFPGSVGGQSFWRNILAGKDLMTEVPPDHWLIDDYYDPKPGTTGKIYSTRGAFLPKVDFDPMEFGMPPKQLSTTDTAQLLGLIVASKVLEDARSVQFGKVDKSDISVILGVASATEMVGQMASRIQRPHWIKALRDAGIPESKVVEVCDRIEATYPEWDESTFPGLLGNVVAGRIANRLDLGGTNCVVDAACASSLGAVAMAVRELQAGDSNLVITGGVDALNDTFMYMCFSQTPALSPTGDCRPFSADADGTMLGEGIGMLALRRLEDARRDNDRIYAVIRGIGSSSDGKSGSIYAPESKGQALAIRRAYEMTDYDVDEVELIEAHGTATKAGDAAEFGGLQVAFEDKSASGDKQWCALGSVKSQIGHTKSAAGSASLFKVVMALHHKVLPPTIKVSEPNPALKIDKSPFYLNTETRPWIHDPATTRKGSVSSFGFGGSNFHVALEEYRSEATRGRYHASPVELLPFAGSTARDVVAAAQAAAEQLNECTLPVLAARLQKEFVAPGAYRLAIIAEDSQSAIAQIQQAAKKVDGQPDEAFNMPNKIHYGVGTEQPKVGFLFPGQGSQYVNMGAELACEFDQVRGAWDIASTIAGYRLDQVVYPIPVFTDADRAEQAAVLTSTEWAQPAIGCVSSSMLNLLTTLEVKPDAVAGHSYGEVTALYAAGALTTQASLLAVSRRRGELMKEAASIPGSMTAVRAGQDEVQAYLDSWDCVVVIANINSPSQVVIAGATGEIEKAEAQLKAADVIFRRLGVANAFHTELVGPSAEPFHEFLTDVEVSKPKVKVYSNTTASVYNTKPNEIRKTLAWQLANPVRFQEMIEQMHDDGIRLFLEVGPGSLLAGMVNDCLKGRDFSVVSMDNKKLDGRAAFWNALGSLAAAGVALNFEALWQDFAEGDILPESIARSPVTVKLNGANHGKPYPPENGSAGVPQPNPEVATAAPTASTPAVAAAVNEPAAAQSAVPVRDANWVAAFQSLQQQTLEAQKSFQQTLGDAHQAFLRASEVAFAQLGGVAGVTTGMPAAATTEPVQVAPAQPVPVAQVEALPTEVPVAAPMTSTPLAGADFETLLLNIVAEKTGYPQEMLTLDMELESGLGIDSIKRVEILSSLQETLPHLGELDTAELAELNTLGEIIELANASVPAGAPAAVAAAPVSAAAPPDIDFEAMLLEVVAEKTGYPKEMLTLDMELESGLGIDSIKRVEILSALQEQIPQLGEMDTAALAELNTLGEIITFASGASGATDAPVASTDETTVTIEEPSSEIPEMTRFEVVSENREACGIAIGQIDKAAPLHLVGDRTGVAEKLAELLATAGVETAISNEVPEDSQWLVLLTGLNVAKDSTTETLTKLNIEAFEQVRRCAGEMSTNGRLLVTVQATGGDFGLSGAGDTAWSSGLAALAKTASREWPEVAVKAIDVAIKGRSKKRIAQELFAELIAGGPELEVGLMSDQRITLVAVADAEDTKGRPIELADDSVIVVSGGARGVTAACLHELLGRKPAKLAILGRTPLIEEPASLSGFATDAELKKALLGQYTEAGRQVTPIELNKEVSNILNMREVLANLEQLTATGSQVIYLPTDITDATSVEAAVARAREELGPVNVIVHAAGVLADKEIYKKTVEQFQFVFQTKVAGLQNLLNATASDPLTHLVCFSSVAARTGNKGQVDYAMANEILNRVCQAEQAKRGKGFVARSIGWGPWAGGMVDPALAGHFRAQGIELIPIKDGACLFADEIEGRNGDCVEIVYGGGLDTDRKDRGIKHMSLRVHASQHPQISSHLIQGAPVVPLALVNQWGLSIAAALNPSATVTRVRDLNVLKGVELEAFDGTGDWLNIECEKSAAGDLLNMVISDADNIPRYRLSIDLDDEEIYQADTETEIRKEMKLDKWEWTPKHIYEELLFHGEKLQVVKQLLGISEAGCRGILQMPDESDLERWRVAMLDGGLQLALLWERKRSGLASLPTKLGEMHWHKAAKLGGPVTCELMLKKATNLVATWSIVFTNVEKQIIATMEDVSIHVLLAKASGIRTP